MLTQEGELHNRESVLYLYIFKTTKDIYLKKLGTFLNIYSEALHSKVKKTSISMLPHAAHFHLLVFSPVHSRKLYLGASWKKTLRSHQWWLQDFLLGVNTIETRNLL